MSNRTARLIAKIAEYLPEISEGHAEWLSKNPEEIVEALKWLTPSLRRFLENQEGVSLVELHPSWDFLIIQHENYPEIGVAVSNNSGSLGQGLRLMINGGKYQEKFTAPCGCCNWFRQLIPLCGEVEAGRFGADKLRSTCQRVGIKTVVLHCWKGNMRENENVKFVEPYNKTEMEEKIDTNRFIEVFGNLFSVEERSGEIISLKKFFNK